MSKIIKKLEQTQELLDKPEEVRIINPDEPNTRDEKDEFDKPLILINVLSEYYEIPL
jgi:hypothetical protein